MKGAASQEQQEQHRRSSIAYLPPSDVIAALFASLHHFHFWRRKVRTVL